MTRRQRLGRRRGLWAGAALVAVALAGTAVAAELAADVKTFTGCLSSGDGVIVKVKEGLAPKSACSSGQTLARISGGDITKISVTGGLTGGGDNGDIMIGLDPKYSLPQSCATGKIAEWNGSAWVCGTDNDTVYTAGTGLDLSAGNQLGIEPAYRVKNAPDCTTGEFATGFTDAGVIECAAPAPPSGAEVWQKTAGTGNAIDLPNGEGVDLAMLTLPAGTFLITAAATIRDESGVGDDQVAAQCRLRNGAFVTLPVPDGYVDIGEGQTLPGATTLVHGLITFASNDTVRFTCFAEGDNNKAANVVVTALRVGTVHTQ